MLPNEVYQLKNSTHKDCGSFLAFICICMKEVKDENVFNGTKQWNDEQTMHFLYSTESIVEWIPSQMEIYASHRASYLRLQMFIQQFFNWNLKSEMRGKDGWSRKPQDSRCQLHNIDLGGATISSLPLVSSLASRGQRRVEERWCLKAELKQ